jgi:hypothetical protein
MSINITGEANGILLWRLMSSTTDAKEAEYFKRLNEAAMKFHRVWFVDLVTERESRSNQVIWCLTWLADKGVWDISKFHHSAGAVELTPRMIWFQSQCAG